MKFDPVRRDTPTDLLIAAMEEVQDASQAIVILVRDQSATHETHHVFATKDMTLAQLSWLMESVKLYVHKSAMDSEE